MLHLGIPDSAQRYEHAYQNNMGLAYIQNSFFYFLSLIAALQETRTAKEMTQQ